MFFLQASTAANWFARALEQPAGSFAFVFGLIAALVFGCVWVTKFTTAHKIHAERDREDVKSVKAKLDGLVTDISMIKGTLALIQSGLNMPSLTQAHSPVSLNALGRETARKMGMDAIVARNRDKILGFLDGHIDKKNAYDIQQLCIETASTRPELFFSEEDAGHIKNFAYAEGKPLVYYGGMIGVIVRDFYFAERGIRVEEVDLHDPAKQETKGRK